MVGGLHLKSARLMSGAVCECLRCHVPGPKQVMEAALLRAARNIPSVRLQLYTIPHMSPDGERIACVMMGVKYDSSKPKGRKPELYLQVKTSTPHTLPRTEVTTSISGAKGPYHLGL
jgi:hypothetical protein